MEEGGSATDPPPEAGNNKEAVDAGGEVVDEDADAAGVRGDAGGASASVEPPTKLDQLTAGEASKAFWKARVAHHNPFAALEGEEDDGEGKVIPVTMLFKKALEEAGLELFNVLGNGHCLPLALTHQANIDDHNDAPETATELRSMVVQNLRQVLPHRKNGSETEKRLTVEEQTFVSQMIGVQGINAAGELSSSGILSAEVLDKIAKRCRVQVTLPQLPQDCANPGTWLRGATAQKACIEAGLAVSVLDEILAYVGSSSCDMLEFFLVPLAKHFKRPILVLVPHIDTTGTGCADEPVKFDRVKLWSVGIHSAPQVPKHARPMIIANLPFNGTIVLGSNQAVALDHWQPVAFNKNAPAETTSEENLVVLGLERESATMLASASPTATSDTSPRKKPVRDKTEHLTTRLDQLDLICDSSPEILEAAVDLMKDCAAHALNSPEREGNGAQQKYVINFLCERSAQTCSRLRKQCQVALAAIGPTPYLGNAAEPVDRSSAPSDSPMGLIAEADPLIKAILLELIPSGTPPADEKVDVDLFLRRHQGYAKAHLLLQSCNSDRKPETKQTRHNLEVLMGKAETSLVLLRRLYADTLSKVEASLSGKTEGFQPVHARGGKDKKKDKLVYAAEIAAQIREVMEMQRAETGMVKNLMFGVGRGPRVEGDKGAQQAQVDKQYTTHQGMRKASNPRGNGN